MFDIFYSGKKPNLFAHERSADSIEHAQQLSRTRFFWWVNYLCDYQDWDWLWEPVPWQAHQRHAWPSQHQQDSGTYLVPKSDYTETNYHNDRSIKRLSCLDHWYIPDYIDASSIDYTWHPNPLDPPYIYHFDTQHHWDRIGGPEYRVPGATDIKFLDDIVAKTCSKKNYWHIPNWIDPDSIDYSWVPNPADPPYIYEFAVEWGWDHIGGPEYHIPGATERKYLDIFVAKTLPDKSKFEIYDNISDNDMVLRWQPNPTEKPYIYVFGNQWYLPEVRASVKYTVPDATELKFLDYPKSQRLPDGTNFVKLHACDFDYSWEPDPGDPPYIYVFGNQHWPSNIMPTVEYRVPGAVNKKFLDYPQAQLPTTKENWHNLINLEFDFDYSWCPDPGDPPYIYVFGNQWHSAEVMPTVEYRVEGAEEIKYIDEPKAILRPDQTLWTIPEEIVSENIDFSWVPDPGSPPYTYHFGSDYQSSIGLTYSVPGATEIKFAGDIPKIAVEKPVITNLDIFYLDYSNTLSTTRFEQLKEKYPNIQRVRFANDLLSTIRRCMAKATTSRVWIISSRNDYTNFDFNWHSEPWQRSMTHVFGSQWNKWSDTFLINRWDFERNAKWAKDIEQFPNLNFVSDQTVHAPTDAYNVYLIDFGNIETDRCEQMLSAKCRVVRRVRFFDSYLQTLRRIIENISEPYIWIASSVCDYNDFDFSWQPEAWQKDMLHVFPSGSEKFGDTFFVPVVALQNQIEQIELLDWFDTINYCNDQSACRWSIPVIAHNEDSHVDQVKNLNNSAPLVLITNRQIDQKNLPLVNLWRSQTRTIVPLDPGAGAVIVPRDAVNAVQTQLYDYPYINKNYRNWSQDYPIDVVFISNGESVAEQHFDHLKNSLKGRSNQLHLVDRVPGRRAAYQKAAEMSTTPWFFAVFAKLKVEETFDWNWLPDRMQQPKHYIFHAVNPVNKLVYGHQAMIAYNRQLTLNHNGTGLDFTLDQAHEVMPIVSGQAVYYTDPWTCWRTAFRECIKLQYSMPDVENEYRLKCWLEQNYQGDLGQWSCIGAQDAVDYYRQVQGNFEQLKLSYDWAWLAEFARLKYNFDT
jgi:hypothetical protein